MSDFGWLKHTFNQLAGLTWWAELRNETFILVNYTEKTTCVLLASKIDDGQPGMDVRLSFE